MDIDRPPDIVVVAGGDPVPVDLVASIPDAAVVIAADAGVARARQLGLDVDVAVGDFDSLAEADVSRLAELAGEVRAFDADKDATDLELALEVAAERPSARVLVLGVEGGRPDHALANLLVASSDRFAHLDVELVLANGRAWVVRDRLAGRLPAGALLSVVPVHGPATVSIDGVRWPLDRTELASGTTRGVSNEALGGPASVVVHRGAALCIAPRTLEEP